MTEKETNTRQPGKLRIVLDIPMNVPYNSAVANAIGAWCNGNTWVSKTFVEGSNPSAPAKRKPPHFVEVFSIA